MKSAWLDRDLCLQKVSATISLVKRLSENDYPHTDSKEALAKLLAVYENDKRLLTNIRPEAEPDTILEYCRRANINIVRLKSFLGLLLRSSNLRNAFEIYFPIKVLSQELLEQPTCVVLSSEWIFSPYTYPVALPELPQFIFIGVPASECENPLIMPLAGHELGHVVWSRRGAKQKYDPEIRSCILDLYRKHWPRVLELFRPLAPPERLEIDMFLRGIWNKSYKLAQRQLEEIFCDYLGLSIFGNSFLYSFRYLLAPSLGQYRSVLYPRLDKRTAYLEHAAKQFGMKLDSDFHESFSEEEPQLSPADTLLVEIADEATELLYKRMLRPVEEYRGRVPMFVQCDDEEKHARECLWNLVPPATVSSIVPIVNAAWSIRLDVDAWDILGHVEDNDDRRAMKLRVLRDLVLKSFEVYEYRIRLEKHAA